MKLVVCLLQALTEYRAELRDDPIINTHLAKLYDNLLEQNLIRVIEPFSRVQVRTWGGGFTKKTQQLIIAGRYTASYQILVFIFHFLQYQCVRRVHIWFAVRWNVHHLAGESFAVIRSNILRTQLKSELEKANSLWALLVPRIFKRCLNDCCLWTLTIITKLTLNITEVGPC